MSSLKEKTLSSLIWKLVERGGNQIILLAVQIVMARLLAPEEFGMLAIMLVFVNIGNVLVQSGLNTALIQSPDATDDDFSTVFWLSLGMSVVLYAATFFVAVPIAAFYDSPAIVWPLRGLSLVFLVNAYNATQVAKVSRELAFKKIAIATLISVFVSGGIGIFLARNGAGLWSLVAQQLSYQVVNCIALAFQVDWKPRPVFSWQRARTMFSFGWKLLVSGLIDTGYQSLSDLVIGKQFNTTNLGYVSQGKKYPHALGSMLDGAIQPVMLSAVSRVQNDVSYVKRLVRRALKTSSFLIIPAMTAFALMAEPIVAVLLGEKWLVSVPFLRMYCFVYSLLPIHTSNLQALNGMGRSDLFLRLEIVKKVIGISVLAFTAFVLGDITMMVAGYMLTGLLSTFINAYPNKKVIGYSYSEQIKDIMPSVAMSALSAAIAYPISMLGFGGITTIVMQLVVMVTVYLGISCALRVEAFEYLMETFKTLLNNFAIKGDR